jgi:hypothetical protein
MRRVGSLQSTSGHTTAVWLFLPAGTLGDYSAFLRYLAELANATLLVPSARWITAEASAVATRHGISLRVFDLDRSPRWLDAKPISHGKAAPHAVISPSRHSFPSLPPALKRVHKLNEPAGMPDRHCITA